MKDLSIKDIIAFKSRSDKSKKNFIANLKLDIQKELSGAGGNYWVTSLSAISNTYKSGDLKLITNKIEELEAKIEGSDNKKTIDQYKRNIDILFNYENIDFKKKKPPVEINLLKKHKLDSVLALHGLNIKVIPHHVFSFQNKKTSDVGAIWFIAKLDGYTKDDLGVFTEILYIYLKTNFSKSHNPNPKYCVAVDVFNNSEVNFAQIQKGEVKSILEATLIEIKSLL